MINAAYLHLLTNHIPVFGFLFGIGLLIYGIIRKSSEIKRVAAFILFLAALGTLVAYFSGHNAEEMVEHLPGVMEEAIDRHEEAAKFPFYLSIIVGILSAIYLFLPVKFGELIILVLSLFSFGASIYAAKTGGEIKHSAEQRLTPTSTGEGLYEGESEKENEEGSYEEEEEE